MSDEAETKELIIYVTDALSKANNLIDRIGVNKELDYWRAVELLDKVKDGYPDLVNQHSDLYREMLETLAVALCRGENMVQADAIIDIYKDQFPNSQLPERMRIVEEKTSNTFTSLDL